MLIITLLFEQGIRRVEEGGNGPRNQQHNQRHGIGHNHQKSMLLVDEVRLDEHPEDEVGGEQGEVTG